MNVVSRGKKLCLLKKMKIIIQTAPEKKSVLYFFVVKTWQFLLLIILILASILNSYTEKVTSTTSPGVYITLGTIFVLVLIFNYFFTKKSIKGYKYIITNKKKVIIIYGFLGKNKRIIPYHQISDINQSSNFIENLMGYSTIYIDSTSFSANRTRANKKTQKMEGLTDENADHIMGIISKYIVESPKSVS